MPTITRPRPHTKATPLTRRGADRHALYQRAVQSVEPEIDFVDKTFKKLRARFPTRLREDFCGTFNTSCEFVRRRPGNHALGLDIDPDPVRWGQAHNAAPLTDDQRSRLTILKRNVLDATDPREHPLDCILAMNFSYWCFTERATMLRYFRAVLASLGGSGKGGVFFLDHYGGSDALIEQEERRRIPSLRSGSGARGGDGGFTYIWEQKQYNPITGELLTAIHFEFPDGTDYRDAFTYTWRLWLLTEVRDLLAEAGFAKSTIYWEGDDGKGGGDGVFKPTEKGDACRAYIAYVVAEA